MNLFDPLIRPYQMLPSEPGSNANEGVLRILQKCSITGASPSDCLMSYSGHSLGKSYPSAEMQSVYSTALADWAERIRIILKHIYLIHRWTLTSTTTPAHSWSGSNGKVSPPDAILYHTQDTQLLGVSYRFAGGKHSAYTFKAPQTELQNTLTNVP